MAKLPIRRPSEAPWMAARSSFHCAYGNRGDAEQQRAVKRGWHISRRGPGNARGRRAHGSRQHNRGLWQNSDGDVDEEAPSSEMATTYTQNQTRGGTASARLTPEACIAGGRYPSDVRVMVHMGWPFTIDPLRELSTRKVALVNGGEGLCNAIYIDDLVDGMLLAAETPAAVGEVFLISGEEPVPWKDFLPGV